jgi:predicted outer membrane repeat protein
MESILPAVSCQFETSDAAAGSALSFTGGFLTSNRVQYTLTERNKYGLGGAIYVSNNTYTLSGLAFNNNSAFLGGALFASSDFSSGSSLSSLSYNANNALLGEDSPSPTSSPPAGLPVQICHMQEQVKGPTLPFSLPRLHHQSRQSRIWTCRRKVIPIPPLSHLYGCLSEYLLQERSMSP